jgi:Putative Ig domain
MKTSTSSSKVLTAVFIAALSAALPANAFAQAEAAQAQLAEAQTQAAIAQAQVQTAQARAQFAAVELDATKLDTGSRKKFSTSVARGWAWIQTQCTASPVTDQCAAAAIEMASNQCAASAKFLKKDTKSWQYLSFGLLMASAAFTGVGAASTLAGSTVVPKVFSTLGGATGLGTVAASANTNVSSDQTALLSINTTLNQFITYVTTGTTKGAAAAPAIAPNLRGSGVVGSAFSYQIVATNSPTSFLVTGLPAGLSASASTGLISGTPTAAGNTTVTLQATNSSGTSSNATLTLNIAAAAPAAAPGINSAAAASGTVGSQFGYQISATNSPTSYSIPAGSSLPTGLSLNATTGFISGTPTAAGTIPVTLTATNAIGTSNPFALTFTIAASAPAGNGPAPNDLVYKVASLYGTACSAAALGSTSK